MKLLNTLVAKLKTATKLRTPRRVLQTILKNKTLYQQGFQILKPELNIKNDEK